MNILANQPVHVTDEAFVQDDRAPGTWRALQIRVVVFLAVLIALDLVVGRVLTRVHSRVQVGQSVGDINRALAANADVLILGSSRAKHSYVDDALSRQLGLKVFNAGADGRGLYYARALAALVSAQRIPRLVILDIAYFPSERNRVSPLGPFYGRAPQFDKALVGDDWRLRVELSSQAHRFNGLVFSMVNNFRHHPPQSSRGFVPLRGVLRGRAAALDAPIKAASDAPLGPSFERLLVDFVDETRARGSDLIFVESPSWTKRLSSEAMATYMRVAAAKRVPFFHFDRVQRPTLVGPSHFHDGSHLNERGARLFSQTFGDELRDYLESRRPSLGK